MEYLNHRSEAGGAAIAAAYTTPPEAETVSGGPASAIASWPSSPAGGVRFADVTGAPIEAVQAPVRAFAGLASGPTVDARVDLVMEDLARLGAFERSVLCVASPTGSGLGLASATLEYLTRGDCATVALQYSLHPSFLSPDRVAMGREQNRALLHALEWRLQGLPEGRRPRLVGFGESLGAHAAPRRPVPARGGGWAAPGRDGPGPVPGDPAESKWAKQWRLDPAKADPDGEVAEVASYEEWFALPADDRARRRYVLLSHHEDPITRFEPALVVQEPGWLGPAAARPPGISRLACWYPLTTFVLTLVDVKNAMEVTPGWFAACGHRARS